MRAAAVAVAVCLSGCVSTVRDWRELGERSLPFEDMWKAVV